MTPARRAGETAAALLTTAIWIVFYGVLFGMLTLQDLLSGPQLVPYTKFKNQGTLDEFLTEIPAFFDPALMTVLGTSS
jgi:hypothetical protein